MVSQTEQNGQNETLENDNRLKGKESRQSKKEKEERKKKTFLSSPRYPKQQKVVYCCMFCKMLSAQFFSFMYGV